MNSNAYKDSYPVHFVRTRGLDEEGFELWRRGVLSRGRPNPNSHVVSVRLLPKRRYPWSVRCLSVFCCFCPWGKGLFKHRFTSWYQRYWQREENSLSAWLSTRYLFKVVQVFKSRVQISWNTNVRHCRWLVYGELQNCCSQKFLYVVYETRLWSTSARH